MTRVLALRTEFKAAGTALSVTDFVVSATAQTLAEFPDVNSRTDGVSVWPRRRVHIGLAVALPDGQYDVTLTLAGTIGLVVLVIFLFLRRFVATVPTIRSATSLFEAAIAGNTSAAFSGAR